MGAGENGRTSWMSVCDEKDGERRCSPEGESASDVGVSVCPVSEYTSARERRSYTFEKPSQR